MVDKEFSAEEVDDIEADIIAAAITPSKPGMAKLLEKIRMIWFGCAKGSPL